MLISSLFSLERKYLHYLSFWKAFNCFDLFLFTSNVVTEQYCFEGTSGDRLVQPYEKHGQVRSLRAMSGCVGIISEGGDPKNSLASPLQFGTYPGSR